MSDQTSWPQSPDEEFTTPQWQTDETRVISVPARARRHLTWRTAGFGAVLLILLGCAGAAGWLAYTNKGGADRWQARAGVLQRNVDALNILVVRRTVLLNARAGHLNRLATNVEQSQSALTQSEGDVQSLEQRQRRLANEKSQLEDERASLQEVASNS